MNKKPTKTVKSNRKIVEFLQYSHIESEHPIEDLPLELQVARGSAFALWSLSKSERNKKIIKESNGLTYLAR